MNQEFKQLHRQVTYLKYYAFTSSLALIVFLFSAFRHDQQTFDVIRAKGIVIEDSAGKDRILIGAPIPSSPYRVRTDTALVRKHWGTHYQNTDQFMKWYSNYYHGAVGMVVLNEKGFDRIAVGDRLPDPNSGKRMFEIAGMTWNDREGWERGGLGVNTTKDGKARTAVGLDDDNGEAVHLVALEDGTKGLIIGGETGHLMIGMSKKNGEWFQNKEAYTGIKFFDKKGNLVWEKQMNSDQKTAKE
ncbi:MAG TPA: hypothetical protein VFT06_03385 [Flavisolibacter sp.]|nr:hypothetical protein [Flavisolibacter sp.]